MHFGEHLTIDGYGGNEAKLNDHAMVLGWLSELPDLLHMSKLAEPQIYKYEADDQAVKDPGGLTGIILIAESHISIHTFPKRGFVTADVYTCKNGMDTEFIISDFKKRFDLKEVETNFIKRGTKYPAENIYS